jgi:hypothetical protein
MYFSLRLLRLSLQSLQSLQQLLRCLQQLGRPPQQRLLAPWLVTNRQPLLAQLRLGLLDPQR